jgi:hypothetical protein
MSLDPTDPWDPDPRDKSRSVRIRATPIPAIDVTDPWTGETAL